MAAHELSEEADDRDEAGHRRCDLLVRSIDFKPLMVEYDSSAIGSGNGVDTQRQIAFVSLAPCGAGEKQRTGARRAGCCDDLAADHDRIDQYEGERLTRFAFVGRKRGSEMKPNAGSGRNLLWRHGWVGGGDGRRDQTQDDKRAQGDAPRSAGDRRDKERAHGTAFDSAENMPSFNGSRPSDRVTHKSAIMPRAVQYRVPSIPSLHHLGCQHHVARRCSPEPRGT